MPRSFCTSSIKRGHGLFKKNKFGSSCACRRVKTSSKLAIVYAGNVSFMTVDFPTCLAPVSKVHLLVSTRFFQNWSNCSWNIFHMISPSNLKSKLIIDTENVQFNRKQRLI